MELATKNELPIMRPLKVLVPLIKDDLKQADLAAKNAPVPFYRAAGEKMLEARGQVARGEWESWVRQNFRIGIRAAEQYMALARATASLQIRDAIRDEEELTFREAVRRHTANKNFGQPAGWQADIKENVRQARVEAQRIAEEHLTRQQERDAEKKLALRLIDIGFKVLVKELHPDKGGSKDAMARLSRVRARLKEHV